MAYEAASVILYYYIKKLYKCYYIMAVVLVMNVYQFVSVWVD